MLSSWQKLFGYLIGTAAILFFLLQTIVPMLQKYGTLTINSLWIGAFAAPLLFTYLMSSSQLKWLNLKSIRIFFLIYLLVWVFIPLLQWYLGYGEEGFGFGIAVSLPWMIVNEIFFFLLIASILVAKKKQRYRAV